MFIQSHDGIITNPSNLFYVLHSCMTKYIYIVRDDSDRIMALDLNQNIIVLC